MKNKKIGFFGGCFNPPTIAHIELANIAIEYAGLDKLIFVPMGNCYQKDELVDFKHRFEMLKIATSKFDKIEISDMQINQEHITYAIDSFKKIDEEYKCEKYFIMGSANFEKIKNWKSYEELKKYKFIIFERNETIENTDNIIHICTKKFKNVSSKLIREQMKNNNENIDFIQKEVLKYIQENKLYK